MKITFHGYNNQAFMFAKLLFAKFKKSISLFYFQNCKLKFLHISNGKLFCRTKENFLLDATYIHLLTVRITIYLPRQPIDLNQY